MFVCWENIGEADSEDHFGALSFKWRGSFRLQPGWYRGILSSLILKQEDQGRFFMVDMALTTGVIENRWFIESFLYNPREPENTQYRKEERYV